jgi:hypothetical protein
VVLSGSLRGSSLNTRLARLVTATRRIVLPNWCPAMTAGFDIAELTGNGTVGDRVVHLRETRGVLIEQ